MHGDENPPKSSSGFAEALVEWYSSFGAVVWYTSIGSLFAGLFCVACMLRAMNLISTTWAFLFLLPTLSCFITAAVSANWNLSVNSQASSRSPENNNEVTDDSPDNGKPLNDVSLHSPPPTYKVGSSQSAV
ncbi:hypothetical protein NW768_007494 [Fusarium equiseti]|uniref:Uncharacterized protein n=1 Tax=Fusarium equiseti TaxID=61235 RepID=A0ABQ8R7S8_FUSEQ|nr:hypothetical protein NW768_007494 [Fusarium equiseti]